MSGLPGSLPVYRHQAPVFSVVTPVYNGAVFIERCYQTLLDQTCQDWEWVVVDDGSDDDTLQRLRRIQDSRLRLFSHPVNRGRGYARAKAIKESRGEWMVVWDADDLYFPDRLERMLDAKNRGYDFCCSYAAVVDNRMSLKGVRGFHPGANGIPKYFVHHSLGCRLDIARKVGYDARFSTGEDATITWVLSAMYRGHFIEEALTVYQEEHDVSVSKAIATNQAQLAQIRAIYAREMLPLSLSQYVTLQVKLLLKRAVLEVMRIAPSIYRTTLRHRSYGITRAEYTLAPERLAYLQRFTISETG